MANMRYTAGTILANDENFGDLLTELPHIEVESKFDVPRTIEPQQLLRLLMRRLQQPDAQTDFRLHLWRTFVAETVVRKYASRLGTISIMQRLGGLNAIKRKSKIKHLKGSSGIRIRREDKVDLPNSVDPKSFALRRYHLRPRDVQYLGELHRKKYRIAIEHQYMGRVYTINIDRTYPASDPAKTLQQLEIEYKGITVGGFEKLDRLSRKATVDAICSDITAIGAFVSACLTTEGVPHQHSGVTKTRWLRSVKQAQTVLQAA